MADTGAPWNIPYVENADLVKDYPTASLALANAIDAGLDAAYVGIGTNVVSAIKTNAFSTTSTSFVDITDFSVTITPSAASSKVLIIGHISVTNDTGGAPAPFQLLRDSTNIAVSTAGSSAQSTGGMAQITNADIAQAGGLVFLDSPATTSAIVYKVQLRTTSGASPSYMNRSFTGALGTVSTLTAIEVAA